MKDISLDRNDHNDEYSLAACRTVAAAAKSGLE